MKIIVIGLGSMGKRRIGLLLNKFNDIEVAGVDTSQERCEQIKALYNINTYSSITLAIEAEEPYAVLVCTSPISHGSIILECIRKGLHIFSEINLLYDKYDEILKEAGKYKVMLFLSSTLLYRNEIQIIKNFVLEDKSKVNYRYHVGQYLPDWHPWEDYRNFFVGDKRTNGCREILAIDMPWIINTFGRIKGIKVIKDKISSLEIDYPDNYLILLEHETGNKGVLIADVVSRKAVRELLVYSENLYLTWDGTPNGLYKYDLSNKVMKNIKSYDSIQKDNRYSDNIIENAYLDELITFINKIRNNENKERYTFEDDKYTLQIIDEIEGISLK
jgi:predicted dehydrogenase